MWCYISFVIQTSSFLLKLLLYISILLFGIFGPAIILFEITHNEAILLLWAIPWIFTALLTMKKAGINIFTGKENGL